MSNMDYSKFKRVYKEIMKEAVLKCIDDGEYYEVDAEDNPGFQFSNDALHYLNLVGEAANNVAQLLGSYHWPDD